LTDDIDENDNAWVEVPAPLEEEEQVLRQEAEEEKQPRKGSHVGDILDELQWDFEEVLEDDIPPKDTSAPLPYETDAGSLKEYVYKQVSNPFDALELCGFDYAYVAKLAANSNEYAENVLLIRVADKNNRFCGIKWKRITMKDMYRFLGIMLKISIAPVDGEGYAAYFRRDNKVVCGVEIQNTKGFAIDYMSLARFKQIRAALHPENSAYSASDKGYQLRSTIQQINMCSLRVFNASCQMTFDEGGIACRSRFCPIRQYNKDKPSKFRVDMFICADAHSYHIYHVDVYQGRNSSNIGIDDTIASIPTTQKAVLNAMIQWVWSMTLQAEEGICPLTTDTSVLSWHTLYERDSTLPPMAHAEATGRVGTRISLTCRSHNQGEHSSKL
jgi:hypothetical protein